MALSYAQLKAAYLNMGFGVQPDAGDDASLVTITGLSQGGLSDSAALEAVGDLLSDTTVVAAASYQFFTGKGPGQPGFFYLVNSEGNGDLNANPNDLNDEYYVGGPTSPAGPNGFNQENRYYNFAINLATGGGEGAAAFATAYGSMTFAAAVSAAYEAIIGDTEAVAAGYDPVAAKIYVASRIGYFTDIANERAGGATDLAVKAIMMGYLLNEAIKADVGKVAVALDRFLADLGQDGVAAGFGQDLIGAYRAVEFVANQAGFNTANPAHSVGGVFTGDFDDVIVADPSQIAGAIIDGRGGQDTLDIRAAVTVGSLELRAGLILSNGPAVLRGIETLILRGGSVSGPNLPGLKTILMAPTNYVPSLAANQSIIGGAGADSILQTAATGTIAAGGGADEIDVFAPSFLGSVNLGEGDDRISISLMGSVLGPSASIVGGSGDDSLWLAGAARVSAASVSGFEHVRLEGSAELSLQQHNDWRQIFENVASPGNILRIAGAGALTTLAAIEDYRFTIDALAQSVTLDGAASDIDLGGGADELITNGVASLSGGDFEGGSGTDTFSVTVANASLAGANISGFETLRLADMRSLTLSTAQHAGFLAVEGVGHNTLTLSGAGSLTTSASIEAYWFTLDASAQSITLGGSQTDIDLGSGNDTLILSAVSPNAGRAFGGGAGADTLSIQGAMPSLDLMSFSGFETLALANNASATLSLAQFLGFATINAPGQNELTRRGGYETFTLYNHGIERIILLNAGGWMTIGSDNFYIRTLVNGGGRFFVTNRTGVTIEGQDDGYEITNSNVHIISHNEDSLGAALYELRGVVSGSITATGSVNHLVLHAGVDITGLTTNFSQAFGKLSLWTGTGTDYRMTSAQYAQLVTTGVAGSVDVFGANLTLRVSDGGTVSFTDTGVAEQGGAFIHVIRQTGGTTIFTSSDDSSHQSSLLLYGGADIVQFNQLSVANGDLNDSLGVTFFSTASDKLRLQIGGMASAGLQTVSNPGQDLMIANYGTVEVEVSFATATAGSSAATVGGLVAQVIKDVGAVGTGAFNILFYGGGDVVIYQVDVLNDDGDLDVGEFTLELGLQIVGIADDAFSAIHFLG